MKKIISLFLALTFCVSLGTISINAETVVPNGEWKTCSYNQEDNFIEFVLKEDSVITFECTSPVEDDGDRHTAYLELFYNDGIKAGIRACDSEFLSSINNNPVYKFEYYLKKGAYKFNFQLSYYSSYYGVITAKYKLSSTPLSTRKVKTPKISYVVEDESSNYSNRLKFVWTDDKDYDGIELWTKTNTGKWELKQTATNSDYYRNYGFTSYYYLGNIYYYKIRAYKKCVGFNYYSDFSNVVSMKKLSKPTIKVKSSKKKTATVSITASAKPSIKLSTKTVKLVAGKSKTIKLKGVSKKQAKKIKWTSSKKKIATVNKNGKITAKKAGKTVITAKYKNKKYKCTVTVVAKESTQSSSEYETIYNKYAKKIKSAAPSSGISELAEIAMEGVGKMADYMWNAKGIDGQYATYEKWAGKLMDVYLNEAR